MFKSSSFLPSLLLPSLLAGLFSSPVMAQAQVPLRAAGLSQKTVAAKSAVSHGGGGVDTKNFERWQSGNLRGFRLKAGGLFDAEQSRLTPSGEKLLKQVEVAIAALGKHSGFIWCYADGLGFDAFQRDLTMKRAQKVKLFLEEKLTDVSSYECKGWGKERPQSYSPSASVLPPARNEHVLEIIVDLKSLVQAQNSSAVPDAGKADGDNGRDNFAKHLGLHSADESDVSASLQGTKGEDESAASAGQLGLQVRPGQGLVVPKEEFNTVIPHEKVGQERDKMTPDELKKLEEEEKRRTWEQHEFGVWREHR